MKKYYIQKNLLQKLNPNSNFLNLNLILYNIIIIIKFIYPLRMI